MEDAFASRALPRLLALTLVACGGRYVSQGQGGDPDGAQQDPGSSTTGGKPSGRGGQSSGKAGEPVTAGMSTGTGGTGFGFGGSIGIAGSAIMTGGSVGIAGSLGVGGTFAIGGSFGTGGADPGMPANDYTLCGLYCVATNHFCPEQASSVCHETCLADLALANNACAAQKREELSCITSELNLAQGCALDATGKYCGAPEAQPITCTPGGCETALFGDATGCHATIRCGDYEVDLHCLETAAAPACSCYINGKHMADLAIGVDSAKAACGTEGARVLCVQQL